MKKKIGIVILVLFVIAQFIRIDKTNPEIDETVNFESMVNVTSEVKNVLDIACMDCHSNTTVYPWYSNVAPVSWFLRKHINGGREHLNFSEWGNYSDDEKEHLAREVVEVVDGKEMPMLTYWVMHPKAKLSDEERSLLVDFFSELEN